MVVIDLEHPTVLIALKSDDERLVKVDTSPLAGLTQQLLGDVLVDAPPSDDIISNVYQNVEGFVQSSSFVYHFKRLLTFLKIELMLRLSTIP